uniref:Huntingtin-interacting protein 1-related protein n=1 Tax=Naja naja TaxID=35670 RepID=A0A8C6X1K1_NAJNA
KHFLAVAIYGSPQLLPKYVSRNLQIVEGLTVSINKAINAQEVAVKEKHARNILLKLELWKKDSEAGKVGSHTFWSVVNRLPLSSNAVLCWKFCHVFHKLLRDGHPNVLKDSVRYKSELSDMSRMWGHLSEGYGQLCSIYLKLLRTKMEFHTKNPRFPGNLQMSDRQLDETGENDVNNFFQLTVEMFDYLECELNLFQTVFSSLDMSCSVSVTAAGQCHLAPLILLHPNILWFTLFLHIFPLGLPADTLQGHRDRFLEQFKKLKDLFYRSSNLQYFKRLIQIPQLPENPPNFLRASALSEHISPVVVIPLEASSPDSEPIMDLVEMETSSQKSLFDNKFDDIFGSSFSNDPFNFNTIIHFLLCRAELEEQKHLKQQALDESDFLRTELDEWRKRHEDTEKAQRSLTEIERKAQTTEQRYVKLKEKYSELVQNHADLLRKNAEVTKQVTMARQVQSDTERDKKELEDTFQRLSEQAQRKTQEQAEILETLKRELIASKQELQCLQSTVDSTAQVGLSLPFCDKYSRKKAGPQQPFEHKQCGSETLHYLGMLKDKATLESADCAAVRNCLNQITSIGQDLRPKGLDVEEEKLGDLVDEEMAATAAAVEIAAARIEVRCRNVRFLLCPTPSCKITLEREILGSCTDLMQAIQVLVLASKDLQQEIVESGRGAASPKEFYARNSRWTEGLISASKAVGWGATVMVDAADLVVQGNGKFEELMVCSHEIAASTAQLVAASKVKADKDSVNLSKLQIASRGVNQATAKVVASTKSGKSQIQEKDSMDFSDMTLTQIKRQEMDSQVRVLELESQLQKERQRLGELRKKHYELGGVAEGWDENGK